MTLEVSEVFYSLQGEGLRAGSANIFVRLKGCKAKNACYAAGIKCDTEFESGIQYTIQDLAAKIKSIGRGCNNIIWTGGEPLDQLTDDITKYFQDLGYYQAIETSGLHPVVANIDYVVVSPKVAEHVIKKNFTHVNELRYVRHKGQDIPLPSITADSYYLSPHSRGWDIDADNIRHCIELILNNPQWKLSIQQHKIWNIV
jgi:7-carboxy-7-deazaguanine synthase